MENEISLGPTIILMAVVTASCRLLPTLLLGNKKLQKDLHLFLSFSPVAILFAMLTPAIFLVHGDLNFSLANEFFWVSIPTCLLAWRLKSMGMTVFVGVALLALWRLL